MNKNAFQNQILEKVLILLFILLIHCYIQYDYMRFW